MEKIKKFEKKTVVNIIALLGSSGIIIGLNYIFAKLIEKNHLWEAFREIILLRGPFGR